MDVLVDAPELLRNVYALRAVRHALFAARAQARLAEPGNGAVVAHEVRPPRARVPGLKPAFGNHALVQALVVVQENRRYVERIRARHAILAIVARNRVELHHALGRLFEKGEFLARELFEGRIGAEIVLEVLHFHHSAQNRQHPREAAREPERPRRHAHFGLAPLELGNERVRYVGEPAAQ